MRIQNIYESITVREHLHDPKSKIKIIRYIQSELEKTIFGDPYKFNNVFLKLNE